MMDKIGQFAIGYTCFLAGLGVGVALMDSVNKQRREEDQATALRKVAEDDQLAMMRKIADDAAANPEASPPAIARAVAREIQRDLTRRSGVPGHSL